MKRILKIVLPLVALGLILVWAFRPSPVPADFVAVGRGDLQVTVDEEGRTRVRHRYVVSAPVPGRMSRIQLEPGDEVVARKTVLAQFHPTDPALLDVRTRAELEARARAAQSALGGARAERERVRAELALARSELERMAPLAEEGVLAPRELEAAERRVEALEQALQSAEFAVRTAEHQVEVAKASLIQARGGPTAATPLFSPVDGVVLRRLQESEVVVPAGQPLIEIGQLEDLEIVADLLSSAAVRVREGQPVLIEHWGGDHPLHGRVRRVEPSGFTKISALGVEEQRVNVVIDFTDPPEARRAIGDGFRVEVRIVVWESADVLKVPTSSLFRHEGRWAVYTVNGGQAVLQPVDIGQRSGLEAEVLDGLEAGERIVVFPSDAIRPGVRLVSRS